MTPEGKVKKKVDALLKRYGDDVYRFMPVQSRWGTKTLDYLCCHFGQFFAVETKRAGEDLTTLQKDHRAAMEAAGGVVFRVRDEAELQRLRDWLNSGYPYDRAGEG